MLWTNLYAAAIISFAVFFLLGLVAFGRAVQDNPEEP